MNKLAHLDRIGLFASTACAVHCAAIAILPLLLTGLQLQEWMEHELELVIVSGALVIAALSAWRGYKRHCSKPIIIAFAAFSALLLGAALLEDALALHGLMTALMVLSGLGLALTHWFNLRACRACGCAPQPQPS